INNVVIASPSNRSLPCNSIERAASIDLTSRVNTFAEEIFSRPFRERAEQSRDPSNLQSSALHSIETAVRKGKLNCVACSTIVQGIRQLIEDETVEEEIDEFIYKACVTLDLATPYICEAA
ncbi:hypothetical protein PMAYCL1PPCAC_04609, partial [Pristionchus mayeri]